MPATEFKNDTFYTLAGGSLTLDDQRDFVLLAGDDVDYDYWTATYTFSGGWSGSVDMGGGDDVVAFGSGHYAVNGGEGFDLANFAMVPYIARVGMEANGGWAPVGIHATLGGSATFGGVSVTWTNSAYQTSQKFTYTNPSYGAFTHSLAGFEALIGAEGDDVLIGTDDGVLEVFSGGIGGNDSIDGMGGEDWVIYDRVDDWWTQAKLVVDLRQGRSDQTLRHADEQKILTDTLSGIESLASRALDTRFIGDDNNNSFLPVYGAFRFDGGKGIDTLVLDARGFTSGLAASLIGRAHNTTPNYPNGWTVDLAAGTAQAYGVTGSSGKLISVENVIGTVRDDIITGNGRANRLEGFDGNDTINGGGGDDIIIGGEGVDQITGGKGRDTFVFTQGGQMIISDFTFGEDRLQLTGQNPLAKSVAVGGIDVLINSLGADLTITQLDLTPVATLTNGLTQLGKLFSKTWSKEAVTYVGTEAVDQMEGNKDANVMLGQEGNDRIDGGGGDDDIDGDDGDDRLNGGGGKDTLHGGTGRDILAGGGANDVLYGGSDADTLRGGGGKDLLDGGSGRDTMTGGGGADIFVLSDNRDSGNIGGLIGDLITDFNVFEDKLDFSGFIQAGIPVTKAALSLKKVMERGADASFTLLLDDASSNGKIEVATLEFAKGTTKENVLKKLKLIAEGELGDGVESVGGGVFNVGSAVREFFTGEGSQIINAITGAHSIHAGAGDDTINGGSGAERLYGGMGNDIVRGGGGDDFLFGGRGSDVLEGGAGNDTLITGNGEDTVDGGKGKDKIMLGAGTNHVTGGAGKDTFIFTKDAGKGITHLNDFDPDQDKLIFDKSLKALDKFRMEVVDNVTNVYYQHKLHGEIQESLLFVIDGDSRMLESILNNF